MNDNLLSPQWSDSEHNFVAKLVDEGKTPSEVLEAYRAQNQFQPRSEGAIRQHVTLYRATKKGVSEPPSKPLVTSTSNPASSSPWSEEELRFLDDCAEKGLSYNDVRALHTKRGFPFRGTELSRRLVQAVIAFTARSKPSEMEAAPSSPRVPSTPSWPTEPSAFATKEPTRTAVVKTAEKKEETHSSNATDQFAFTLRAAETVAEAFSKDEQALILDLAEKLCYTPAAVLKRATQLVQGLVQFPPDERKLILQALETLLALKR